MASDTGASNVGAGRRTLWKWTSRRLIRQAEASQSRVGASSPVGGRWRQGHPPWDCRKMVRERVKGTSWLLDLGMGGGEMLSTLAPLPPQTYATEGYPLNLPTARSR